MLGVDAADFDISTSSGQVLMDALLDALVGILLAGVTKADISIVRFVTPVGGRRHLLAGSVDVEIKIRASTIAQGSAIGAMLQQKANDQSSTGMSALFVQHAGAGGQGVVVTASMGSTPDVSESTTTGGNAAGGSSSSSSSSDEMSSGTVLIIIALVFVGTSFCCCMLMLGGLGLLFGNRLLKSEEDEKEETSVEMETPRKSRKSASKARSPTAVSSLKGGGGDEGSPATVMFQSQAVWSSDEDDDDDRYGTAIETASVIVQGVSKVEERASYSHGEEVRLAAASPAKANFQMDIGELVSWTPVRTPPRRILPGRRSPLADGAVWMAGMTAEADERVAKAAAEYKAKTEADNGEQKQLATELELACAKLERA